MALVFHKIRAQVRRAVAWCVAATLTASGCAPEQEVSSEPGSGPSVVCTIGMITDLASTIAGDHAEVVGLVEAGIDPHLYQPTRSDIQRLVDADLVFYNGLLLEGRMTEALERVEAGGGRAIAVAGGIDPTDLLADEAYEGHPDPHVWMDPRLWRTAVEAIRAELSRRSPEHAPGFDRRASDLLVEFDRFDEYAAGVLESVPETQRVLVTAHDAFGYFGRRYGFEVVGIQGISTESEAGLRRIEELVDMLVDRRIGAVFVESTVSERNVNALIEGAAARGHTVKIGGELFSDAMGPAGTYRGTYLGMMDHNITTIAQALGGEAPERGLNGEL